MSFTQEQLRAIYAMAMGYGTEAGGTPYQLTVAMRDGKPIGQSGYTIGVIQVDFGQQGAAAASRFVGLVKPWANAMGNSFEDSDSELVVKLTSKGAEWRELKAADKKLLALLNFEWVTRHAG